MFYSLHASYHLPLYSSVILLSPSMDFKIHKPTDSRLIPDKDTFLVTIEINIPLYVFEVLNHLHMYFYI